jgi:hypothetical protein
VSDWERYAWADEATEATVALVADGPASAEQLLERLGPVEPRGEMTFDEALGLQGTLYDDGSFEQRAVVQVDRLPGEGGEWWATVEPNGFRARSALPVLAAGGPAAAFYWNVNGVMNVRKVEREEIVADFDPVLDDEDDAHPAATSMALLERWTGVSIAEPWFLGAKPTFVLQAPAR